VARHVVLALPDLVIEVLAKGLALRDEVLDFLRRVHEQGSHDAMLARDHHVPIIRGWPRVRWASRVRVLR
jgi:hypothetical protein